MFSLKQGTARARWISFQYFPWLHSYGTENVFPASSIFCYHADRWAESRFRFYLEKYMFQETKQYNSLFVHIISTHQSSLGRYMFSYSKQLGIPNNWEFLSSDHRWDHHCSHEQLLRSCSRRQHWGWGVVLLYPRTTGQVCNCMRETKSWAWATIAYFLSPFQPFSFSHTYRCAIQQLLQYNINYKN